MDALTILKSNLELFKKLNPLDCAIIITDDKGTILEYVNGKSFNLNIVVNSKVSEAGSVAKCLNTGKNFTQIYQVKFTEFL